MPCGGPKMLLDGSFGCCRVQGELSGLQQGFVCRHDLRKVLLDRKGVGVYEAKELEKVLFLVVNRSGR
jgi:hypothetical protein